jgi:hypothetical protein
VLHKKKVKSWNFDGKMLDLIKWKELEINHLRDVSNEKTIFTRIFSLVESHDFICFDLPHL